jgi:hypothetical protein
MLRKGVNNPNKGQARRFVESYFGRGYASAKVTTNPRTMNRSQTRVARELHDTIPGSMQHSSGLAMVNRTRTKHLVFVNKRRFLRQPRQSKFRTPKELELVLVHELGHAAYRRRQKKLGKRAFLVDSEVISSMIEFEYEAQHYSKEYSQYMSNAYKAPFYTIASQFGNRVALEIHSHFSPRVRQVLLRELLGRNFVRKENVLKWLQQKLEQHNIRDQKLKKEIREYVER